MILVKTEAEMLELGEFFAQNLTLPAVFELIGDVGAGKTTFTRGLASGLGVAEPVTSPSFTISKRYYFPITTATAPLEQTSASTAKATGELVHYDFYRLDDPGLMSDDLAETLATPNVVTVIEWGGDVARLLPEAKYQLQIALNEDGSRSVVCGSAAVPVENLWKTRKELCKTCGKIVDKNITTVENQNSTVDNSGTTVEKCEKPIEELNAVGNIG